MFVLKSQLGAKDNNGVEIILSHLNYGFIMIVDFNIYNEIWKRSLTSICSRVTKLLDITEK